MRVLNIVFLLILVLALPCSFLHAQQYLGSISGEVQDATSAKIAGAIVTVVENSTHFKTTARTNGSGAYSIPGLNPGTYTVTASSQGFKTATQLNVTLTVGQLQQVNFNLSLGEATETVEVIGSNSLLDTGSAQIATTLDQQEVVDLPNEGRDPYVQATLAVGVTNNGSGGYFQGHSSQYTNPFSGVAVQIASDGISGHNRLTLDGIPNDPPERLSGSTYAGYTPSPEAVQETKVSTSIFDAQLGHGDGTVTNVAVRGGTNRFHGSAYYIFQNTYLNANLYQNVPNQNLCYPGTSGCANTTTPTRRGNDQLSQTGFVIDGPVWIPKVYNGRDKTYFMFSYERYHSHVSNAFTGLMPDDKERTGDFSELCSSFNSAGLCTSGRQIYDPLSPIVNGARTEYFPYNNIAGPNNVGITRGLDPAGKALITYYPSVGSNFSTVQNYISTDTSFPNNYPSMIGRVDQSFGQKNKMNIILFRSSLTQSTPLEGYPKGIGPAGTNEGGYRVYRNTRGGSIDDVQTFNSSTVLDSRLGVVWHPFGLTNPFNQNFDLSSINMSSTGLPYTSFPGVTSNSDGSTIAAGVSGGSTNTSQVSTSLTGSLEEILTKVWGRHSVRFGFEGNLLNYNVQPSESGFSGLTIDRTFTQLKPATGDASSGNAFASLLLGYHNALQYTINPSYALHQLYIAPFTQDDWRVTNRLTLNLGVRWDYEAPLTERYNRFVNNFCTSCTQPLPPLAPLGLTGGLEFASSSNRFAYPRDLNNFQPRIGAAYQVSPTTVLRAGYGIIYFNTIESPIGTGYSATTGNTSTGTGGSNETSTFQPATTLSNPFPNGVVLPTGNSLGLATGVGTNISFVDPNHVQPRAQQLAFNIQQAFPGNLQVQIGYVNFRPQELEVNQNINVLPQQYYSTSTDPATNLANQNSLNAAVTNPMYGKLPAGSLSSLTGTTIARNLLLVPFPEFGSVTEDYRSIGHQRYDALQIQVSHPMSHHVSFQGSFTWNKLIDWTGFANNYGDGTPLTKSVDAGPSLITTIFGTVELPSFASHAYYTRLLLGGWKLNTVMRAQNGSLISEPGSVYQIGDPLYRAPRTFQRMFNTCYEDVNGNPVSTSYTSSGAVSVEACDSNSPTSNPVYRQRYQYTVATNPYYINERQRIYPLVDASLFKQFMLREGVSFEIRGEFFNIGNRPNFGGPGTGLNSSTFGVVTLNQVNDARTGQLTARINF